MKISGRGGVDRRTRMCIYYDSISYYNVFVKIIIHICSWSGELKAVTDTRRGAGPEVGKDFVS